MKVTRSLSRRTISRSRKPAGGDRGHGRGAPAQVASRQSQKTPRPKRAAEQAGTNRAEQVWRRVQSRHVGSAEQVGRAWAARTLADTRAARDIRSSHKSGRVRSRTLAHTRTAREEDGVAAEHHITQHLPYKGGGLRHTAARLPSKDRTCASATAAAAATDCFERCFERCCAPPAAPRSAPPPRETRAAARQRHRAQQRARRPRRASIRARGPSCPASDARARGSRRLRATASTAPARAWAARSLDEATTRREALRRQLRQSLGQRAAEVGGRS
jgi:hypothetical protein